MWAFQWGTKKAQKNDIFPEMIPWAFVNAKNELKFKVSSKTDENCQIFAQITLYNYYLQSPFEFIVQKC